MSKPSRARYRTTNWPAYNAALKRRGSLTVWLDAELPWQAPSSGRAGRQAVFSDAAIQFCLTLKCMFALGLRQATGLAESLLKLAQLEWNVPDYSTLSRRQKTLSVAITARPSNGGLHLLVDSTGVKMLGEGEWKIKKHGADYRRQWRKVHLGVDAQTLEIRAIEVTDNANGDAPMLVSGTLEVALSHSKNTTGLTVHLDHGWHYKMQPYRAMHAQRGVTQSMSRKGNCFDNAVIENFLGTLKAEYYHLAKFDGVGALEAGVHDYIRYYNHERIKLNCKDSVRWITG